MKKLMALCFALLFTVLGVLAFVNYPHEGIEQIESDKKRIVIEKPTGTTNELFLRSINNSLRTIGADIMYKYTDVSGKKTHNIYFITDHAENFISVKGLPKNISLKEDECLSTTDPEGYVTHKLKISSMFQDVTFYNWKKAAAYDLSSCVYYISKDQVNRVTDAIATLGYRVTVNTEAFISGKLPVLLFVLIPICLMLMSMIFYILSNGKKNVLRKMEGYQSFNILYDELRSNGKAFLLIFLVVEAVKICLAIFMFRDCWVFYLAFSVRYALLGIFTFITGCAIMFSLISIQNSAEHVKGKVPKKGMYYTATIVKSVFIVFITFFMTIAIRNVQIAYNTYRTSQFVVSKIGDYVTFPVYNLNTSISGMGDQYLEFYRLTVDAYDGILIGSGNYERDVISGTTLCEDFGQDSIEVNQNYLELNPVFDIKGEMIQPSTFRHDTINVLIPEKKKDRIKKYAESMPVWYQKEANFIFYDGVKSNIYTYNAATGTGSYGRIDQPVMIVLHSEDLKDTSVLSYCSQGAYFIKPHTNDPYNELLPIIKKAGIEKTTLDTPYIASSFEETLHHQYQMLFLYGTQTLLLSIGLACLILFSAQLYCANNRKKIACCLIEGYSLLRCIKVHIIATCCCYALSFVATSMMGSAMQVTMNDYIILGGFVVEFLIIFFLCKKYTRANLYEISKGAE